MEGMVSIRTEVRPGDIARIVLMHSDYYWREHKFNEEFEAYVAAPLAELIMRKRDDERLWVVEQDGTVKGCIALSRIDGETGQLRWFYLEPELRGKGMGKHLIGCLLGFAKEKGYRRVVLWTVDTLWEAIRVYERCGFKRTGKEAHRLWGLDLVEERYEILL